MTKMLIVDDHPLSRDGTAHALRQLPDRPQVLEAGTLEQAFAVLAAHAVDILLLDLDLGPTRGIDTLRQARAWLDAQGMATRIIVLSGLAEPQLVRQALEHYATGFIPKAATQAVLLEAVTRTLAGGLYVPQPVTESSSPAAERGNAAAQPDAEALLQRLTERERAVAALLIQGLTYKRIAQQLQGPDGRAISDQTVRAHVGNIAWKLGVEENAKAGVMARLAQLGIVFDRLPKGQG